jgi:hypothetical protein
MTFLQNRLNQWRIITDTKMGEGFATSTTGGYR